MKCLKCNNDVQEASVFCTHCGSKLDKKESESPEVDITDKQEDSLSLENDTIGEVLPDGNKEKNKSNKKIIFSIILIFIGIFTCGAILFYKGMSKESVKIERPIDSYSADFILLYDSKNHSEGTGDYYLASSKGEPVKLGSDLSFYTFNQFILDKDNSKKFLFTDGQDNLYEVDEKGTKEKVGTDIELDSLQISGDMKRYTFIDKDASLYFKKSGMDKEKIANMVSSNQIHNNNETVSYIDNEENLYIWGKDKTSNKIASDVNYYSISDYKETMVYYKLDGGSYIFYPETNKSEKFSDMNVSYLDIDAKDNLYYIEADSLFFKEKDKEAVKLTNDVTDFKIEEGQLFYLNKDGFIYHKALKEKEFIKLSNEFESLSIYLYSGNLIYVDKDKTIFKADKNSDKKEKIADDVLEIYKDNSNIYYLTKDKGLCKIENDWKSTKVADNVKEVGTLKDSEIFYITEDNKLTVYKMDFENVKSYGVSGKNISFYNDKNEVYLVQGNNKASKIVSDVRQYSYAFIGNPTQNFFQNRLMASDLQGYWLDEGSYYINIDAKKNSILLGGVNDAAYYLFKESEDYVSENEVVLECYYDEDNSGKIKEDNYSDTITITKVDENTIKFGNLGEYKKSSEKEAEKSLEVSRAAFRSEMEAYNTAESIKGVVLNLKTQSITLKKEIESKEISYVLNKSSYYIWDVTVDNENNIWCLIDIEDSTSGMAFESWVRLKYFDVNIKN